VKTTTLHSFTSRKNKL